MKIIETLKSNVGTVMGIVTSLAATLAAASVGLGLLFTVCDSSPQEQDVISPTPVVQEIATPTPLPTIIFELPTETPIPTVNPVCQTLTVEEQKRFKSLCNISDDEIKTAEEKEERDRMMELLEQMLCEQRKIALITDGGDTKATASYVSGECESTE